MYGIELLVEEHNNILKLNAIVRQICIGILDGNPLDVEDFEMMIDFARNYADKYHHGKEEKILFKQMQEQLGEVAYNLIQHGMYVEHDLGRLHISEIEEAVKLYKQDSKTEYKLDIISNAIGYTKLLKRHIDKENEVVYTYAEKNLNDEIKKQINEDTSSFEETAQKEKVQEKYLGILEKLENKYQ